MADKKISTINLEVDLDCSCCFKKITETLEKYPEIQTQILNREKKTVTISGPFDPEKLMKCICCKAGKYIKSYVIVKPKPPEPPVSKLEPKPVPKPVPRLDPKPEPKPVCCRQCYEGQRGGPCWHGWAPHPCPPPPPSVFVYASKVTRPACARAPMPPHVFAGEKNQRAGPCNL